MGDLGTTQCSFRNLLAPSYKSRAKNTNNKKEFCSKIDLWKVVFQRYGPQFPQLLASSIVVPTRVTGPNYIPTRMRNGGGISELVLRCVRANRMAPE